jgi:UMP-CMP kinase
VFVLECPEKVIEARLLSRGKISQRWDDQDIPIIRNPLQNYRSQSLPVIAAMEKLGKKIVRIDTTQSIEKVFADISNELKQIAQ